MKTVHIQAQLSAIMVPTKLKVTTESDVVLTGGKKNEQQGKVKKITTGSIVTVAPFIDGQSYYNQLVSESLKAEGKDPTEHKPSARPWGQHINGTPFVTHKECLYVDFIYESSGTTHYEIDGQVISEADIVGLKPSPVQSAESQGGLDKKVIFRTIKLANVLSIETV